MKQVIMCAWCGVMMGLAVGCSDSGVSRHDELSGSGSTFIKPMMDRWAELYQQSQGVAINYQGKGSTAGINDMIDSITDFACSDAPLTPEQIKKAEQAGGPVIHIPLVMGGVVPAYNLPGLAKPVRFTGPVLADIFRGTIKKWNDRRLQELQQPGVILPDQPITTVHRVDGSGTTFIFTDYLSRVSPAWKEQIGTNTTVTWPPDSGAEPGNPGVANFIKRSPGALGYIELIYALENHIPYGEVRNRAGHWVKASLPTVTAAAAGALTNIPEDLRYSITNAPGPEAYPISGTTWAIFYQKQPAQRGATLRAFLSWATHAGQKSVEKLNYASLPAGLVQRVDAKLANIQLAP